MPDISKIKLGNEVYVLKDNIARNNLAPIYDETTTYAKNDVCIYKGALYKCIQSINIPEKWNSNHWQAATIATVLSMYAPIESPIFTGSPKAPTVDYGRYDSNIHDNYIATCGFVMSALSMVAKIDIDGTSLVTSDLD